MHYSRIPSSDNHVLMSICKFFIVGNCKNWLISFERQQISFIDLNFFVCRWCCCCYCWWIEIKWNEKKFSKWQSFDYSRVIIFDFKSNNFCVDTQHFKAHFPFSVFFHQHHLIVHSSSSSGVIHLTVLKDFRLNRYLC